MLSFAGGLKVYVALEPCDMRKSYDGLYTLAKEHLGRDPRGGALFAFTNRRRTRLKLLYFDGTGTCVLAKRLEKGNFSWPKASVSGKRDLSLTPEALQLLIDGVDLREGARRAWYERE